MIFPIGHRKRLVFRHYGSPTKKNKISNTIAIIVLLSIPVTIFILAWIGYFFGGK